MNADKTALSGKNRTAEYRILILYMEFFRFSFLMKYEFNKQESIKQYST